ncbi:MAG: hypothetical protein KKB21_02760 [Nanoarchaeota archaeon]|nr:hypothetical protein [Nanoarchaeota archaeon]MBU4086476.1 hypothetical protein [Nanoarchaeota archaeon]
MVAFISIEARARELIEKLFRNTEERSRCPYLRKDEISAYCSKDMRTGETISEQRIYVCEIHSLQLWCLDISRCDKCIWYLGEKFK